MRHIAETHYCHWREVLILRAITQLTGIVVAPATHLPRGQHGAGMSATCIQRNHAAQPSYIHRGRRRCLRVVAQLAESVVAPTLHRAGGHQRTRVQSASRHAAYA